MTTLREQVADAVAAARALPGTTPGRTSDVDRRAADAVIPIILGRAAEVCATLAETTYDDADGFQAALGCEAAIRQIGRTE